MSDDEYEQLDPDNLMVPEKGYYLIIYPRNRTPSNEKQLLESLNEVYLCCGFCCPPELWDYCETLNEVKDEFHLGYHANIVEYGETASVIDRRGCRIGKETRVHHVVAVGPLCRSAIEKACLDQVSAFHEISSCQKHLHFCF